MTFSGDNTPSADVGSKHQVIDPRVTQSCLLDYSIGLVESRRDGFGDVGVCCSGQTMLLAKGNGWANFVWPGLCDIPILLSFCDLILNFVVLFYNCSFRQCSFLSNLFLSVDHQSRHMVAIIIHFTLTNRKKIKILQLKS